MTSIVSEKGQVTIPKALRDRLGLVNGQVLAFEARNGVLTATKVVSGDRFASLAGVAQVPEWAESVDDFIDQVRGEADLT